MARQLQFEDGQEDADVVAYVSVSKLDMQQYASSKSKVNKSSVLCWNEHIFLQGQHASQAVLQDAMIEVHIQEKSQQERNKLVGMYEFSLESIYQRKDHALLHQWVALVDNSQRSKRAQDIAGYLRVSI